MRVLGDIFVLSVSGGPGAQELQSMMFKPKKGDPFCVPERGKDLGGFTRLTALKVEEVTPDSHVYMSCKKMVVKVHRKDPGSVRVCLL